METANKVYKRKRKTKIKWGRFIIFALSFAYIIMFIYTFFSQSVEKVNITYGDIEVIETVTGYITRNEKIVSADISGEIYPIVLEGERVSKNQGVAVVKNENSDYIEEQITKIKNELSTLTTPTVFSNDILVLDNEVNLTLNQLMLSNYNENFSSLSSIRNKIEDKLNKKAVIIGQSGAKGSLENKYYEELNKYKAQLTNTQEELIAPIAGTVAYKLDGYEEIFSYSAIGDYDAKTLNEMNVPSGELVGTVKNNSFKIVDNIEGYVTIISNSERALSASVDKKVQLRFPEISSDKITGKIEFMTIEDGQAVITFRINRGIENLINYRKVKVDLIWDSDSGMVVPTTAIRKEEDGTNKIFVINGNRLVEKQVDINLEFGGESIITNSSGYNLVLYDAIVKDAKTASDEKIIISK